MSTISWYQIAFLFLLTIWAAVSDLRTKKIPNRVVIPSFFFALFLVAFLPSIDPIQHLYSLLLMIVISVPLFSFGWMGGGDIKLLYVLAVSFPLLSFGWLFFTIAIAGGVQALVQMFFTKKKAMPYGIAIFVGFCAFVLPKILAALD